MACDATDSDYFRNYDLLCAEEFLLAQVSYLRAANKEDLLYIYQHTIMEV